MEGGDRDVLAGDLPVTSRKAIMGVLPWPWGRTGGLSGLGPGPQGAPSDSAPRHSRLSVVPAPACRGPVDLVSAALLQEHMGLEAPGAEGVVDGLGQGLHLLVKESSSSVSVRKVGGREKRRTSAQRAAASRKRPLGRQALRRGRARLAQGVRRGSGSPAGLDLLKVLAELVLAGGLDGASGAPGHQVAPAMF